MQINFRDTIEVINIEKEEKINMGNIQIQGTALYCRPMSWLSDEEV